MRNIGIKNVTGTVNQTNNKSLRFVRMRPDSFSTNPLIPPVICIMPTSEPNKYKNAATFMCSTSLSE